MFIIEVRCKEDLLLLDEWVRRLLLLHCTRKYPFYSDLEYPIKIKTHTFLESRLEIDVLIECGKKRIIIELKRSDLGKAIKQVIRRRKFADYVYVAVDLTTYDLLGVLRNYPIAFENGIGFISTKDKVIVLKSYSKRVDESVRYGDMLTYFLRG